MKKFILSTILMLTVTLTVQASGIRVGANVFVGRSFAPRSSVQRNVFFSQRNYIPVQRNVFFGQRNYQRNVFFAPSYVPVQRDVFYGTGGCGSGVGASFNFGY
jgi:hypothetical protein